MFASDALLSLTNLIVTLPNLQALLAHFAVIPGLQINPHKVLLQYGYAGGSL